MTISDKRLIYLTLLICVSCANGPKEIIPGVFALPGGALSGEIGQSQSWSEVVQENGVIDLETRPADPYSVRVGFVLKGEKLYVDPAEGREWSMNMKADPAVRVRFGDHVYPAVAVLVSNVKEREGFAADRDVFRLDLKN